MRLAGGTSVLLLMALAAMAAPNPASAAPPNDDFAQRITMQLGDADTITNEAAGIEAGERLTENDPMSLGCDRQGQAAAAGVHAAATLWWAFKGNGGPITISTQNSGFDTVLAVYEVPTGAMVGCNDDIQPQDLSREELGARVTSELLINSVDGREYAVQAGSCSPAQMCAPNTTTGNITLRVSPTPPNDDRASATPIAAGGPVSATNNGATLEAGETASCGEDPFGKTVWFSYLAPAYGTAVFSASGFDTILAVYRGDSATPLACNDDAISGELGASQIPQIEPPGQPFEVTPGEYVIQVGGFYNTGFAPIAARNGQLAVQVLFTEDTDVDNDGFDHSQDCDDFDPAVHPGAEEIPNNDVDENCDGILAFDRDGDGHLAPPSGDDCNDANPASHPGAPEILNNDLDENCDGIALYDRDGDGYLAPPNGADCNDTDPAVNPGAAEIRGNDVDENCDGRRAPYPALRPLIEMRSYRYNGPDLYLWVREVFVQSVPAGSEIRMGCSGPCSFDSRTSIVTHHPIGKLVIAHGFRLEPGSKFEVRVTKPGWLGREKDFLARRTKPRLDIQHCLSPGEDVRPCGRK